MKLTKYYRQKRSKDQAIQYFLNNFRPFQIKDCTKASWEVKNHFLKKVFQINLEMAMSFSSHNSKRNGAEILIE
jgi:hypothetical protein